MCTEIERNRNISGKFITISISHLSMYIRTYIYICAYIHGKMANRNSNEFTTDISVSFYLYIDRSIYIYILYINTLYREREKYCSNSKH